MAFALPVLVSFLVIFGADVSTACTTGAVYSSCAGSTAVARMEFITGGIGSSVATADEQEVVQGTISFNGTATHVTPLNVDNLNWAASNALVTISGHGSVTKMRTLLQLQGWNGGARRGLDIQFAVLPKIGGGGDCASSLFQASRGGDAPPWNDQDPYKQKPIFRNVFQNALNDINDKIDISSWDIRLWNISCSPNVPVWRYSGHLSSPNPLQRCDRYAPGWRVEAGGTGTSYGGVVEDNFESRFTDKCEIGSSPCVCAQMAGCAWRQHSSGGDRCQTTAGATASASCTSNDCSSAKDACRCAAVSAAAGTNCKWDDSQGTCSTSTTEQVPCSSCWMQPKCKSVRPQAQIPGKVTWVAFSGNEAQLKVAFSTDLGPLPSAAEASIICAEPGEQVTQADASASYTIKTSAMSIVSQKLVLNMSTVRVPREALCSLLLPEGTVIDNSAGLPSVRLEFQDFILRMPDGLAPKVVKFSPESGAQGVKLDTTTATITFDEPVSRGQFSATLTPLAAIGTAPDRSKSQPIPFKAVRGNDVDLDITGMLSKGQLYQITLTKGSIQDQARHVFEGIPDEGWTFVAEGVIVDTRVVSNERSSTPWILIGSIGGSVFTVIFLSFVAWRLCAINSKASSKVVPDAGGDALDTRHSPPQADHKPEINTLAVVEKPAVKVVDQSVTHAVQVSPREHGSKPVKQQALDSLISSMDSFDEPENKFAFVDDGPQPSDSNHHQVSQAAHHQHSLHGNQNRAAHSGHHHHSSNRAHDVSHHGGSHHHSASHRQGVPRTSPKTSPKPSPRQSTTPPKTSPKPSPQQSPTPSPRTKHGEGHGDTHHSEGHHHSGHHHQSHHHSGHHHSGHHHQSGHAASHHQRPLTLKEQMDQAKHERALRECQRHGRG